jgi:hypothetical protein
MVCNNAQYSEVDCVLRLSHAVLYRKGLNGFYDNIQAQHTHVISGNFEAVC